MRRSESNWNAAFMRQNWAFEEICPVPSRGFLLLAFDFLVYTLPHED
jgi:hypothetical protein